MDISGSQFWLIGGPNGAGKTTLASHFRAIVPELPSPLNPDAVSLELLKARGYLGFADPPYDVLRECFLEAANWVAQEIESRLENKEIVGVETVLSTEKYLPLFRRMAEVQGANLIYIGNQNPEISVERVALRFAKGGHDVPADKICSRWQRSLKLLPTFLEIATRAWVYDHSQTPARLVAKKVDGRVRLLPQPTEVEQDVLAQTITASHLDWIRVES